MIVKTAKTAGFCPGVKRAVEDGLRTGRAHPGKKIYTYGPIIHNEQVVEDLQKKRRLPGARGPGKELEQLKERNGHHTVTESPKRFMTWLSKKTLELVDATCYYVQKIHQIVWDKSNEGKDILIIGNGSHPEVEGICGWCRNGADVVETEEEAHQYVHDQEKPLRIVAQTTFNYKKFNKLVEIISKKGYDILVLNTICSATEKRQTEAREIAKEADAMIVIGGKHSSNTQKLFEICSKECANTYYIQKLKDLDVQSLQSMSCVGITAGASTPNNIN